MTFLTIWLLCAIVTGAVASSRGASGFLWLILGVLLGPIALALAYTTGRRCPHCAYRISTKAVLCSNCLRPVQEPKPRTQSVAARLCNRCGRAQNGTHRLCPYCGDPSAPNPAT